MTTADKIKELATRLFDQTRYAYEHGDGHAGHVRNAMATQQALHTAIDEMAKDAARYQRIAYVVSSIYAHGGFFAETANERELSKLLDECGYRHTSPTEWEDAMKEQK